PDHLPSSLYFFLSTTPPPPISTLFPYTTLFRSRSQVGDGRFDARQPVAPAARDLHAQRRLFFAELRGPGLVRSRAAGATGWRARSEEHTSELQSLAYLVCRLLLEKKKQK